MRKLQDRKPVAYQSGDVFKYVDLEFRKMRSTHTVNFTRCGEDRETLRNMTAAMKRMNDRIIALENELIKVKSSHAQKR